MCPQEPNPLTHVDLLSALRWRYAVKKFDPTRQVPADTWASLEEALRLAPSSYGLQPWKFLVIGKGALRDSLVAASWNQRQIADASHMVVFCVRTDVDASFAEHYVDQIARARGVDRASLDAFLKMLLVPLAKPAAEVEQWCARQVYLALGLFLASAASLGVDACPMEGIVAERYDEILGLSSKNLKALVVATAGYRAADDRYAALPKVRFPKSEVLEHLV